MGRSDDDTVVADVIAGVAEDLDLGCGDDTEGLVAVCVAKSDNCTTSVLRIAIVKCFGEDQSFGYLEE